MTTHSQRQTLLTLINNACQNGARRHIACQLINLSVRTLTRWQQVSRQDDQRQTHLRSPHIPANSLSDKEREAVMQLMNSDEFKDLPPSQIVPRLCDQGRYVASVSTLYRLLRQNAQLAHRRLSRPPRKVAKPKPLVALKPNQVYCWDITYLSTTVRGKHFYLYLFVDLYSRKIVGWQIFDVESATLAAQLLHDICLQHHITKDQLTVHSDNGSPMKGETMMATMQRLGVAHSRSRPGVSNDNPYSESLFRTLKYRPQLPQKPFDTLPQARHWMTQFVQWYNFVHRHSAIGFVTPQQRHHYQDIALLKQRERLYLDAKKQNPLRWSGKIRNWSYISQVHLNPNTTKHKEKIIPN